MVSGSVGLASSVVLIVLGPGIWVNVLGYEEAVFPYAYPTLASMILSFSIAWAFTSYDRSRCNTSLESS